MQQPIQLFIKPHHSTHECHQSFVITASPNDSVDKLRDLIFHKTHIIPNRQLLLFQNKLLQSGSRLNQYRGLSNNCTVEVRYANERDWFDRSRSHIDNGIIKLNQQMECLQREQSKIETVTQSLHHKINSAPSLLQLNRCNVDDAGDKEMSALQHKVDEFQSAMNQNGSIRTEIQSLMSSLQTLISNAMTSVNHEEEMKCNVIDKKMQSIEAEIKSLESRLSDLETEKATLRSNSDQHRTELNALRTQHVQRNKVRVKRLCSVDMDKIVDQLKESKVARFKQLEERSSEWDTDNLEIWIRNINRGHFNRDERGYDAFFENLRRECIDGGNLQELASGVCLGLLGLTDDADQQLLMQNVNGLLRMNMENDFIVKGNRCCACLSKCIECVLCPCGHQPYCYQCATKSREHDNRCPICRSQITQVMRTFISGV